MLAWLTSRLTGASEAAYRIWSVMPFLLAVGALSAWLHRRAGAAVAMLFALLATTSTELLILSTEARGYGLAFAAMAMVTIASYEAAPAYGAVASICSRWAWSWGVGLCRQ